MLYWLAIFVATHLPKLPESVDLSQVSDKSLHYGAYAGLAFLLSASLGVNGWSWGRAGLVLGVAGLYGAVDEVLQIPVNRHADVLDWQADMVGAGTGILVYTLLRAACWPLIAQRPRT